MSRKKSSSKPGVKGFQKGRKPTGHAIPIAQPQQPKPSVTRKYGCSCGDELCAAVQRGFENICQILPEANIFVGYKAFGESKTTKALEKSNLWIEQLPDAQRLLTSFKKTHVRVAYHHFPELLLRGKKDTGFLSETTPALAHTLDYPDRYRVLASPDTYHVVPTTTTEEAINTLVRMQWVMGVEHTFQDRTYILSEEEEEELVKFVADAELEAIQVTQLRKEHARVLAQLSALKASVETNKTVPIGLTRTNLTSEEWHKEHPHAARVLFGFRTYADTQAYLKAMFFDYKDGAVLRELDIFPNDKSKDMISFPS